MILRQLVNLILSLLWKSTNFPGISVKSHKGRPKRNRLTPSPAKKTPGISEGGSGGKRLNDGVYPAEAGRGFGASKKRD